MGFIYSNKARKQKDYFVKWGESIEGATYKKVRRRRKVNLKVNTFRSSIKEVVEIVDLLKIKCSVTICGDKANQTRRDTFNMLGVGFNMVVGPKAFFVLKHCRYRYLLFEHTSLSFVRYVYVHSPVAVGSGDGKSFLHAIINSQYGSGNIILRTCIDDIVLKI